MAPYNYSLYALPVADMGLIAQSAGEAQEKLTSTLTIIDGINAMPAGLPASLRQAVSNIRYHVITGLAFVDAFLRTGHNMAQPMIDVEGLRNAIDLQIAAVNTARPLWDQWYKDAVAQGTPEAQLPPPPPVGLTVLPSTVTDVMKPMELRDYLGVGLVAGAVWLIWKVLR